MDPSNLPTLNAILNAISTVLLITGFILIKKQKKTAHRNVMTGALVCSALFLASYLYYHYQVGQVNFPREYPLARKIYLAILIPHIILAIVNLPLIITLVVAAIRGKFELHRKFARFTYPSWLFVSVTGVIIYLFLYQWFPPKAGAASSKNETATAESAVTIVQEKSTAGSLEFSPAKQILRIDAGEETSTAFIQVTNQGDKPVEITKLKGRCACLSVTIPNRVVQPGETQTITGIFETERISGEADKLIAIGTSESGAVDHFVTVTLDVPPLYVIEEDMTTWERGEEPKTKKAIFRVKRDKPIRVLSATSGRSEVTCEVKTIEEGRLYELHLTPKTTNKQILGMIRIETDCEIEAHARPLAYFSVK